jgi:hypothetical protein
VIPIHQSAWKGNSPKFISSILHRAALIGAADDLFLRSAIKT